MWLLRAHVHTLYGSVTNAQIQVKLLVFVHVYRHNKRVIDMSMIVNVRHDRKDVRGYKVIKSAEVRQRRHRYILDGARRACSYITL